MALAFHQNILQEIKECKNTGLLLISKGLGLHLLLSSYLENFKSKSQLVFLLNFGTSDINLLNSLTHKKKFCVTKITKETKTKR